MEKENGIYKIKCKINGAPMKMYFDTGATNVSISLSTALYLFENDLISKEDIKGTTKISTADGTIRDNMLVNLKDVEIAGLHLRNVQAVVSSSINAPLLLGQSAIQKLGRISLNGNILTIHNQISSEKKLMTQKEREGIQEQIKVLIDKQMNDEALYQEYDYKIIDLIEKIEKVFKLNEFELYSKIMSLVSLHKYNEALPDVQEWIQRFANSTANTSSKMTIFFTSAECNIIGDGDKDLGMEHYNRCRNYFMKDESAHFFWFKSTMILHQYCIYKDEGFEKVIISEKDCIKHFMDLDKATIGMINQNQYKNDLVSDLIFGLALSYNEHMVWLNNKKRINSTDYRNRLLVNLRNYFILSAKAGCNNAIKMCNEDYNVDYKKILSQEEIENMNWGF